MAQEIDSWPIISYSYLVPVLNYTQTDVTGYQYGTTANAGPNAVSQVQIGGVNNTLYYDLNGAISHYDAASGDDKFVDWTARGKPWRITKGAANDEANPTARDQFAYGVDGYRYYKKSSWSDEHGVQQVEHTFYVGDFEDIITAANDADYQRVLKTRIGDSVMHIKTVARLDGAQVSSWEYLHRDHLGSVEVITDKNGNVLMDMAFDVFGARRTTDWGSQISDAEMAVLLRDMAINTSRGYTGHEHLDRTGLIHMNGRVYDPVLGGFLSPDPLVQAPYFSQSYNRYSYVWNNPMSLVDPSGYGSAPPTEEVVVTGTAGGGGRDALRNNANLMSMGAMPTIYMPQVGQTFVGVDENGVAQFEDWPWDSDSSEDGGVFSGITSWLGGPAGGAVIPPKNNSSQK